MTETTPSELLQGTLDLLILRALRVEPLHGLGVSRRIAQLTSGAYNVKPGSLFPALHRLEAKGCLRADWGESENRRRAKYYTLTPLGRRHVERETANWRAVVKAMAAAIDATS